MKKWFVVLLLLPCGLGLCQGQQKQIPQELLKKLEKARSGLSKAHQYMLFEDFAATGIFGGGPVEAPAEAAPGSGITQPQGSASAQLQNAAQALPDTYTVWILDGGNWYVSVRKGNVAVFLKLADDGGDMNFNRGSGWCIQPSGGALAKYPYRDGRWGAPQAVSAGALQEEMDRWQQEYILAPAGEMTSDRVRLFEKAAYFEDLDISLPKK